MEYQGTVKRHGDRYRSNGMPVFDYDEVIGYYHEPAWEIEHLSALQRLEFENIMLGDTADWVSHRPQDSPQDIYSNLLGHYGIVCPHPEEWRKPYPSDEDLACFDEDAQRHEKARRTSWTCGACRVLTIVPPKPEPRRRIAMFIDGPKAGLRQAVPLGQPTLNFPVMAEIGFGPLDDDAAIAMALEPGYVTYRPTGRYLEMDPRFEEWALA